MSRGSHEGFQISSTSLHAKLCFILQFSWFSSKKIYICTADCRDILSLNILIPKIIKDFQSILCLKGITGRGFFKFISYWYEIFVIFLIPLAPKSISYFTDEETEWWCVTSSYISHFGSHYWHSLMQSDWCNQTWCLSQCTVSPWEI